MAFAGVVDVEAVAAVVVVVDAGGVVRVRDGGGDVDDGVEGVAVAEEPGVDLGAYGLAFVGVVAGVDGAGVGADGGADDGEAGGAEAVGEGGQCRGEVGGRRQFGGFGEGDGAGQAEVVEADVDDDVAGAGYVEDVPFHSGQQVGADLVGEEPVAGDAGGDDPAAGEAAVELGGEAAAGAGGGGHALDPGVPEGDGDAGALGSQDVDAGDEVPGDEFVGFVEGCGGELVAWDGVADVVGDRGVCGEAGVAGEVEAEGEFLARGDGAFDGVADDLFAGRDGDGLGADEEEGDIGGGVDGAAFGAAGEVGAADLQRGAAVAVAEADAQCVAAACGAQGLAYGLVGEAADLEEFEGFLGVDHGGAVGGDPGCACASAGHAER